MNNTARNRLTFGGLSGENPLAFLALLGLARTLPRICPSARFTWIFEGKWIPQLESDDVLAREELVGILDRELRSIAARGELMLGFPEDDAPQNLTFAPDEYAEICRAAVHVATLDDRSRADLCAALGSDVDYGDASMADTALRTMSGAGHQHFLDSMRRIGDTCEAGDLDKALFETWRYDDAVEKLTLRWDPVDDVRYALRSRNPSGDPARKRMGSVLGANRLAIEAVSLLPTAPGPRDVRTTGFRGRSTRDTYLSWPIWNVPIGIDSIRSLLNLDTLQQDSPDRDELRRRGVAAVYRSQRITVGKLRNFTAARCVG